MATRSLNVVIAGDPKPLGIASRQAEGHIKDVENAGVRMGKTLALGFVAAGAAATGALVVGLKKSVDAAKEAEVSQAKLKAQLDASGISYRAHAKEIDNVIQKHSRLAGVDDEDLQDAFTNLVRATGSVSKSMHDMGLVTDLARAKHIDVTKAADLLGKVHAGNTGVLKRYGIAFDPVTKAQDALKKSTKNATDEQVRAAKAADKAATSQQAIALLQKRFGGQAEAYGKTAAGAQDRFSVALENVEERIGKGVLPVLAKVTGGVANFLAGMDSGKGSGGRFAAGVSEAFERVKAVVQRVIGVVRGYLDRHRADLQSVIVAFKRVADFAKTTFQETLLPIIRRSIAAIKPILEGVGDFIKGIVRLVSGLLSGNWSKAWSGAKEAVSGAFKAIKTILVTQSENVGEIVKDLGPKLIRLIVKGLANLGKALATGIWEGIKAAAAAVPGLAAQALAGIGHAITGAIQKGLGKINIFGDGTGKGDGLGVSVSVPTFGSGGSLMGARPSMAPVAGAAARFGLHTSSGLRPGAITTSGNVSYHSSGEALDEAGTPAGMMGFFNFMKNTAGGRLAELIYGPGKVGIKNGQPYNFGPALNAQHMDHVHVAIDSGAPGVGDGIGFSGLESLWVQAGGSAKMAPLMAHVAQAESGGNPNAMNPSGATGLWQILGKPFAGNAKDPLTNAKMAVWKYQHQGLGAWAASRGTWGRYVGSGETYTAGAVPAKGKSKTFKPGISNEPLGSLTVTGEDAGPDATALLTPPAPRTVGDLLNRSRPLKGFRSGDPLPQESGADPNQPLIDAIATLAELEKQRIDLETTQLANVQASYNVSQSQYGILAQAISDIANGQIGQRLGLSLSGMRAPAGAVSRL